MSHSTPASPPVRILVINPNTSTAMTSALEPVVLSLNLQPVQYTYFTCPSTHSNPGISSINSPTDATKSAEICLPHLLPLLPHHDAFLVACYSQHPLVPLLKSECYQLSASATSGPSGSGARKYVTGIFEASVTVSLSLIPDHQAFGIVSTGEVWEHALQTAVSDYLGYDNMIGANISRFAGCETTGLNAGELHELPAADVRSKMTEATARLLRRFKEQTSGKAEVGAVCLGCAGMVGLGEAVRTACVEELGEERGKSVHIVDGVKAGVGLLFAMARSGF